MALRAESLVGKGWLSGSRVFVDLVVVACHPVRAALEVFLLPDGDAFLDPVDHVGSGLETLLAVGRAYGDYHAGLFDFQAAQAVSNSHIADAPALADFLTHPLQFLGCHFGIGLVLEVQHLAPLVEQPGGAEEGDDGAVEFGANLGGDLVGVQGVVGEVNQREPPLTGGMRAI